jgi:peptidoglycan-N-acetylglucosamine deacetylase
MRIFILFAVVATLLLPGHAPAQETSRFAWPDGRKAAIVLTYDDGAPTHLDIVVPQLAEAGLHGTFFLNAGIAAGEVARWRAASAAGHELANHSLLHPCPAGAFPMEARLHAEGYTITGMLGEIAAMNAMLHAIDGKMVRSYGVPCSRALAGGEDYTDALAASRLVRFVRTGGAGDSIIADPAALDIWRVPSRGFPETATAEDLIAFVKRVEARGGVGVLTFHGVGGDHLRVSAEAHQGLLQYLKQHDDRIWVAPFQQVMEAASRQPPPARP